MAVASVATPPFRRPGWLTAPLVLGILFVLFWVFVAITVDLWAPYDPLKTVAKRLRPPTADHWLGTDVLGRDVLVRTLYGARELMLIAVSVVAVAVTIGSALGAISGFFGGVLGGAIMRLVDVTLSLPPVLLAMAVAASLGAGLQNAALAMIIVWWPVYARLMRGQVLEVKQRDHVEAAIAGGASRWRLLTKHILSLCWTPTLVNATMDFGQVVLLAASLSFIGLGARPPAPEWGSMISEGASSFYSWWIALGPGVAILTVVLGFNFIGDGVRDILDPRTD